MKFLNARVVYSIMFYLLSISLIILTRPSVMFDRNGNIKPFGLGAHKTAFSFGVFAVVLAISCFYVFALIDVVFA